MASRAILFRVEVDGRVLDPTLPTAAALAAKGLVAMADCARAPRNSRRVKAVQLGPGHEELLSGSVFIEIAGDFAQFREASQRNARTQAAPSPAGTASEPRASKVDAIAAPHSIA